MIRAVFALVFFSGSVLAHPGHGALEVHWHLEDLALVALGVAAVAGLTYLAIRKLKR